MLPTIGRLVSSHWKRTMVYLANSIMIAVTPTEVCRLLSEVGFSNTVLDRMSFGIVALIGAQK